MVMQSAAREERVSGSGERDAGVGQRGRAGLQL